MTAREVELSGGAPWGFRMHGGSDQNQPLRISRRYSDSLERSLEVNPGRKASLSGIREGDVISSINGRPTRGMSNSDAHAMLRSAGPVLKLGLNEDREMSPRRRSIGKGSELKRPSQLIAEVQKATPQAPVYATIRPSQSPQNKPLSSSMRSSLNSLPSALNSTPLVKSVVAHEDLPRFHPTNPFYSTMSSNHSSASKLPVPNGRATLSGVDRNKKENVYNDYSSELKSPSFFAKTCEGPNSLPHLHHNENVNGFESERAKSTANDASGASSFDKFNQYSNPGAPNNMNDKNPFETKRNSDPFEKYLRAGNNFNGKSEFNATNLPGSQSETNFRRNEEITKRSTITEHKISEVEEIKTIKKIVLNGSGDATDRTIEHHPVFSSPVKNTRFSQFDYTSHHSQPKDRSFHDTTKTESNMRTPTHHGTEEYFSSSFDKKEEEYRNFSTPTSGYRTANDFTSPTAEAPTEAASKPPVTADAAHAPASPAKREYTIHIPLFYTFYFMIQRLLQCPIVSVKDPLVV